VARMSEALIANRLHLAEKPANRWLSIPFLFTILIPSIADSRPPAAAPASTLRQGQLCLAIQLDGEADTTREWSALIGEGWLFRVVPVSSYGTSKSAQGYSGWDLVVSRADDLSYPDALLLATPPYGSLNEREIASTYGMRAQDAIAWTPRRFQFLTSSKELERARSLYRKIMPANPKAGTDASSAALNQVAGELLSLVSSSPTLGRGAFSVLDAKLIEGVADPPAFARQWASRLSQVPHTVEPAGNAPTPLGELRWIRFRADLLLPAGWKVPPAIHSEPAKCAQ
jgi:hypothetical protein